MSPENSSTNITGLEPIYDKLLADVVKYSNLGHIIVQGDFNAYTNTKPDFVAFDNSCTSNQDDLQYISDQHIQRNNLDTKLVNNSGKCLLNLCKESNLRILNGRTIGDLHGFIMPQNTPQYQLDPIPNKFIWTPEAINLYTLNSNSIESKNKFEQFLKSTFKDSESPVNSFNTILYENALKSAKLVKKVPVRNKNQNRLKRRPWYSESCRELGVTVKNYAKLVNKHPYNSEYRHKFYSFRSRLRRLCKYEENKYKKDIFSELYTYDLTHLSSEITIEEIVTDIRLIKNGKSTSADMISNEMLKNAIPILVKPLHKLFNSIFESGQFPRIWNESLLVLLHTKGDKFDPGK
ncbi:unnamed protein product [Mytilus edulis]|uniref:Endonuclease/exonuclease/phosphatase domain-containing protein n=1 Tax=Mytilus edulis TaxID=6550 RepID=A0A8S3R9E6_MYTED|nr:unnamed protein product [Mytilus edulis]